jgi:tellurite methyltransferase
MKPEDPSKWDDRYRTSKEPGEIAQVLKDFTHLLPDSGHCLDLACGLGANALWLATRGFTVEAWDISTVALEKLNSFARARGVEIETRVADLSTTPISMNSFDCIVVSHYLDRIALPPRLIAALRPEGMLFYQTYTRARVDESGPSNPAFLLGENELLRLFQGLTVRAFRDEGLCGDTTRGFRNRSWLVAQKSR